MKLVFFHQRGILNVVFASLTVSLSLSPLVVLCVAPSLILSPSLVLLCLLSSVWCWQANSLHPLPATMWLLSVSLSNKPRAWEAQRVRGGEFKKGEEEEKKEEEQEENRSW